MSEELEKVKKSLRSVLLSSKGGIRAARLQGEYKELMGSFIEYKKFGFTSLDVFMRYLDDVVKIGYNNEELTYWAKADSTTKHIQQLVSKQRSKPNKKHATSTIRNNFSASRKSYPKHRKPAYYSSTFSPVNRFSRQAKSVSVNIKQMDSNYRSVHYGNYQKKIFHQNKFANIPRLQAKKAIFFTDDVVPTFNNPLNPSPIEAAPRQITTFRQEKAAVQQMPQKTPTTFKEKFSKLLIENERGIHSVNVARLYKEKYGEEIPHKYLSKILDGNVVNLAKLNKVSLGSQMKYILLPLQKKNQNQAANSVSNPVRNSTDVQKCVLMAKDMHQMNESEKVQQVIPHKPLVLSNECKVIVVSVDTIKNKVFVNLASESDQYRLMYSEIRNSYMGAVNPDLDDIVEGAYVITSLHQRARVQSVMKENQTVFVYNIDIGTTDDISIENVRMMSISVAKYPEFSIDCNFDTMSFNMVWSSELSKRFDQLYSEAQLHIKVMQVLSGITCEGKENYQHSVIFYNSSGNINAQLLRDADLENAQKKVCEPDKFQPSPLQLPDEEYCDLFLVKASCTTEIDACIIGEGYSDRLVALEESMLRFYQNPSNHLHLMNPLKVDVIYAVMFEDACVRAKLLSIESNVYNFYLVDSGDNDSIEIAQGDPQCIFALTKEFCELPIQITTVALARLENDSIAMDFDILQHLVDNYISIAPVLAHVLSRQKVNIVDLYDTLGVNINQACYDLIMEEKYLPVLPEFGNAFDCTITHIKHGENLLFLNCNGEGADYLKRSLEVLMHDKEKQRNALPGKIACNLYPGKLCLAAIGKHFYRVRIEKITDIKPKGIQAYLVDVGRFEYFSRGSLFKIENENLVKMPDQAICCKLTPGTVCSQGDGPEISLDMLTSAFDQTDMVVRLDSKEEEIFLISLWFTYKNDKVRVVLNGDNGTTFNATPEIKKEMEPIVAAKIANESFTIYQEKKVEKDNSTLTKQENQFPAFSTNDRNNNLKHDTSVCNEVSELNLQRTNLDLSLINKKDGESYKWKLINIRVEVCISPNHFYMICLHNIEQREFLMKWMHGFYSRSSYVPFKQRDLKKNELYAVLNERDGKMMYDRAKVINFQHGLTSVYYIDLGKYEVLGNSVSVLELHANFKKLPGMVMMARLAGIEPLEGDNLNWTENVNDRLQKLILGQKYVAHVMAVSVEEKLHNKKLYHVCLCDTRSGEDIWINDTIVDDWKQAKYVSSYI